MSENDDPIIELRKTRDEHAKRFNYDVKSVMQFYRFIAGGKGVYEAVEFDCPRADSRRVGKPDGAWLPRVGKSYPGAISFWTEFSLRRYIESGLQAWHESVVNAPVEVVRGSEPARVLYEDEYQIICMPEDISFGNPVVAKLALADKGFRRPQRITLHPVSGEPEEMEALQPEKQ